MRHRLVAVEYRGRACADCRLSGRMLPWVLTEIRTLEHWDRVSLCSDEARAALLAYDHNFETILALPLRRIVRSAAVKDRSREFYVVSHEPREQLLVCHLFTADSEQQVKEVLELMKESGATKATSEWSGSISSWRDMQQSSTTAGSVPAAPGGGTAAGAGRSMSSAAALTSLSTHISTMDSHFFEVLYIGKMKVSGRKVSDSLADDALEKLRQHETDKLKQRRGSLLDTQSNSLTNEADSIQNIKNKSLETAEPKNVSQNPGTENTAPNIAFIPDKISLTQSAENIQVELPTIDQEFDEFFRERIEKCTPKSPITLYKSGFPLALEPDVLILNVPTSISKNNLSILEEDDTDANVSTKHFEKTDSMISEAGSSVMDDIESIKSEQIDEARNNKVLVRRKTEMDMSKNMTENKPFLRDRSASIGTLNLNRTPLAHLIGEQNRTMLFQVGRKEVRLISPDRKQVLLQREVDAIVACHEGRRNKDHMALVCRENDSCVAYLFACDAADVAHDIVNAVRQAISSQAEPSREHTGVTTCYHCPMLWYHRLCEDLEGLTEKRMHALILRRLEQLSVEEQDQIITKYQGGTDDMYEVGEHNAFLMMLLRAHCEGKQLRHVHDTAENRSEFLNQYLGGGTIFTKARRSLSSGFEHLLKRRTSTLELHRNGKKDSSPTTPEAGLLGPTGAVPVALAGVHSHSSSPTPAAVTPDTAQPQYLSNMMDIFMKVGNNSSGMVAKTPPMNGVLARPAPTWRQAMLQQVTTQKPLRDENGNAEVGQSELTPASLLGSAPAPAPNRKKNREELRALWKAAINQAILLVRMEKENARLKERQEVSAVRRIKLEYEELCACAHEAGKLWEALLAPRPAPTRLDPQMLRQAVRQGVPRAKRGEVWYLLAEQYCMHTTPPDTRDYPHYNTPYESLLRMLTSHQHAILIDLGRTFPNHTYFSSALGPGQLGLFNLLKAYSLLDPAVGYCQGLSFVAGVLLLHMEEAEAFLMLRHLMFRRGLRKQYLPDMAALQVQLYQLSRLVKEHLPDLHAQLDTLEVLPTLYAAPWMLTLFTSQFPLGFVTRVFDVLFLDSLEVVFRVCLALLIVHHEALLLCTSLEESMELLKHKMPAMGRTTLDKVIKQVFTLDISQELREYEVEYKVLREELAAVSPRLAQLEERAAHAHRLQQHNDALMEQLEAAMSSIANYQQSQSRFESQVRSLEHSVSVLTKYIISHQDRKHELPPDVRRLCQNPPSRKVGFGPKITSFSNKFHSNEVSEESGGSDPEEKSASEKSKRSILKTGLSTPNLFSKFTKEDLNVLKNGETGKSVSKTSQELEKRTQHSIFKKSLSVNSGLLINRDTINNSNKTNVEVYKNIQAYPLHVLEGNLECNNNNKSNNIDVRKSSESQNQFLDTFKNKILKDNQNNNSRNLLVDSHEQIRQERLFEQQLKHHFDENLKRLDKKLSPNMSYRDDLLNPEEFQNQPKSLSLNFDTRLCLENSKNKEKSSSDSGIGTPVSPTSKVDEDRLKKTDKTEDAIIFHPLSNCDVDIKFDGHSTKLKCLRPIVKGNKGASRETEKKVL